MVAITHGKRKEGPIVEMICKDQISDKVTGGVT